MPISGFCQTYIEPFYYIIYSITINLFITQINKFVLLNYTSYYELYLSFKLVQQES